MIIYLQPTKQKSLFLHGTVLVLLLFNITVCHSISQAEATRFLNQATIGARLDEIQALATSGSYENWINNQIAQPTSSVLAKQKLYG